MMTEAERAEALVAEAQSEPHGRTGWKPDDENAVRVDLMPATGIFDHLLDGEQLAAVAGDGAGAKPVEA